MSDHGLKIQSKPKGGTQHGRSRQRSDGRRDGRHGRYGNARAESRKLQRNAHAGLWAIYVRNGLRLLAVLLTAILSTVFAIFSPKILGNATTILFEGMMGKMNGIPGAQSTFAGIWEIVAFFAVLYVISSLFSYIQQYLMAGVAQNTVYDLRKEVNAKLGKLPLKYFDSRTHGEILSRAVNDVDNISNTLQQSLTQLITSVITILGVIVMMLTISPWLTLILLLTFPLSFIVIKGVASRSQKYFKTPQKELGELNGHVEEMYTGHKIVKALRSRGNFGCQVR